MKCRTGDCRHVDERQGEESEIIWFQPNSMIHLNRPETASSLGRAVGYFEITTLGGRYVFTAAWMGLRSPCHPSVHGPPAIAEVQTFPLWKQRLAHTTGLEGITRGPTEAFRNGALTGQVENDGPGPGPSKKAKKHWELQVRESPQERKKRKPQRRNPYVCPSPR